MSDPDRKSPCDAAKELVHGVRQSDYGSPQENFDRIRVGWSVIVDRPISTREFAHMMTWLKISRDLNKELDDNVTDICGYYEAEFVAGQESRNGWSETLATMEELVFMAPKKDASCE